MLCGFIILDKEACARAVAMLLADDVLLRRWLRLTNKPKRHQKALPHWFKTIKDKFEL